MRTDAPYGSMEAVVGEAALRARVEEWAAAIRDKDVDGALAGYGSDIRAFDLVDPLTYDGISTLRDRLGNWFASFDGPIGFEQRDVTVVAGEGVGFVHSLNHVNGTTTAGDEIDMWWRATLCLKKLDGAWSVIHSHTSVPFDMESGKASVDLSP